MQDKKPKTVITAHGEVTITRRYYTCSPCKTHAFPTDVTLGTEKGYTRILQRFVSRCCALGSYRLSADNLDELCGIHLSHTTIGKIADATAVELAAKRTGDSTIRDAFQEARGEVEFYADGTSVHIRNDEEKAEWREMKTGAFAKRKRGNSASPSEWTTRELPQPTVVSAFAAIESKEEFQQRCQEERRRVGVGGVASALGDGAPWLWNVVRDVFGKTDECLDIYHAAEHISACGKELYRDTSVATEWFERMRLVLLSEGFAGMERELSALLGRLKKGKRKPVQSLLAYLRKNEERLNYGRRLLEGRAIGSGLIEGACKNLVGKRLKQTGACWRLERVNRIAILCAALYSDQWKRCWKIPTKV